MASPAQHGEAVLAAIIPNRYDLFEKAARSITEEHFTDTNQARIFALLARYGSTTNQVMPLKFLSDLVAANASPGTAVLREVYETLAETSPDEGEFEWGLLQLREHRAARETTAAITEAMAITRGAGEENPDLSGPEAAREYLQTAITLIEQEATRADIAEGTMNHEHDEVLAAYRARKAERLAGGARGVMFGIDPIDKLVGGLRAGELCIMAAYSGEGKTQMTVQTAWHGAVKQGKNILFFSTETDRETIRNRIIARHSMEPQFALADGLNSYALETGTLSEQDEEALVRVVSDFDQNPEYGRLHIVQVPGSWTVAMLAQHAKMLQKQFTVDLVIMDYLALLTPERKRNSAREELSDIMKDAKKAAHDLGVPWMSPWQINREGRDSAERTGYYTSRNLSETAEATNSADLIISLIAPEDKARRADVSMQVMKSRRGEQASGIIVEVDYATSYFRDRQFASLGGVSSGGGANVLSL